VADRHDREQLQPRATGATSRSRSPRRPRDRYLLIAAVVMVPAIIGLAQTARW
jgi:uncharacterized membrane protein YdbT with pleckstrin-like domain